MKLIIISGPCGSGKSTVIKNLSKKYRFVDVVYKNCKGSNLNPALLESKLDYTEKWFETVKNYYKNDSSLAISDRSPFDSLAYLQENKEYFNELVNRNFKELSNLKIKVYNLLLTAKPRLLENRIVERSRTNNEDKDKTSNRIENLQKSLDFYQNKNSYFNKVIDNSNLSIQQTIDKFVFILQSISEE